MTNYWTGYNGWMWVFLWETRPKRGTLIFLWWVERYQQPRVFPPYSPAPWRWGWPSCPLWPSPPCSAHSERPRATLSGNRWSHRPRAPHGATGAGHSSSDPPASPCEGETSRSGRGTENRATVKGKRQNRNGQKDETGLRFTLVFDRMGAPLSNSISTTCSWPLLAPQWRGVRPS